MVEKLGTRRYIHPTRAWLLSSEHLPISASKRGGQLLNEIFIYSKDTTSSPGYLKGWRINQIDCCRPWSQNLFKNSHSRHLGIVNAVISLIANRSDRVNETIFSLNWSYYCLDDEYNCECSQIRYTKGTGAIHFS